MTDLEHKAREMAQRHILEIKKSKGEPSNLAHIQEQEINAVFHALAPEDQDAFMSAYIAEQELLIEGDAQEYAIPDRTKIRALAEAHDKKLSVAAAAGPPESAMLRIERASLENQDELDKLKMEMPINQFTEFLEIDSQEISLLSEQKNREADKINKKLDDEESNAAAIGTVVVAIIF